MVRTRRVLDTAGVDAVVAAAHEAATEKGYRVVIVVVDASGRVLALRRTEGAQAASDQVAVDKARTAAISRSCSRGRGTGCCRALGTNSLVAMTTSAGPAVTRRTSPRRCQDCNAATLRWDVPA